MLDKLLLGVAGGLCLAGDCHLRVPVLVLANGCDCPPSVVATYSGGSLAQCDHGGSNQPCFTIALRVSGSDVPGTCYIPGVPIPPTEENPNPPQPPAICSPESGCKFADYKLWIKVAPCAGLNGNCGNGPWQPYDQTGRRSGKPIIVGPPADSEAEVNILIGNLECREYDQTFLWAKSSNGVTHEFRIRWICGKCDKDPVAHEIPN